MQHLAKLLDALWYVSMGLFLGLHAGTILSVVETFDSSRKVDATPGLAPYSDPRFGETANEVVAGFIAQNIFKNNGSVALVLLGVALLACLAYALVLMRAGRASSGSKTLSRLRLAGVIACCVLMLIGALNMHQMKESWPGLYEAEASQETLDARRTSFDASHKLSERVVGGAWFVGALALVVSPWCRRIADEPTQAESESKQ